MQERIVVPALGPATTEVIVGEWRVAVGQTVDEGHVLVDLESGDATFEIRAVAPGRVVACLVPSGGRVSEGDALGVLALDSRGRSRPASSGEPLRSEPIWEVRVFDAPRDGAVRLEPGWEPFGVDGGRLLARRRV